MTFYSAAHVNEAMTSIVDMLQRGGVVALPTETVYGFAADATNPNAVDKIFALKNRPSFNPLICHFASVQDILSHCEGHEKLVELSQLYWPGPLTLILKRRFMSPICSRVTAHLPSLAVRIPNHPIILEVLRQIKRPLAAPSANLSESISPTTAAHVTHYFDQNPLLSAIIDGGPCDIGLESTIVDLTQEQPVLLRPGWLCFEDLKKILPDLKNLSNTQKELKIRAPGMMKRHYAPRIDLRLNATDVLETEALLAFGPNPLTGGQKCLNLSAQGCLNEAAVNLFAMMRALDQPYYSGIVVMPIPSYGIGCAINDRLKRAAVKN